MTTLRSSTDIATELADLRTARAALLKGERVDEVWRDGRRVIYAGITLKDIDAAIAADMAEYDQATASESGARTRSAIGTYF